MALLCVLLLAKLHHIASDMAVLLDAKAWQQCGTSLRLHHGSGRELRVSHRYVGRQRCSCCHAAEVATFAVSMGAFLLPRVLAVLCILAAGYIIGRLACSMFILVLSVAR